jgi:hypothetical protein
MNAMLQNIRFLSSSLAKTYFGHLQEEGTYIPFAKKKRILGMEGRGCE